MRDRRCSGCREPEAEAASGSAQRSPYLALAGVAGFVTHLPPAALHDAAFSLLVLPDTLTSCLSLSTQCLAANAGLETNVSATTASTSCFIIECPPLTTV